MLGTIVNAGAIIAGALLGNLLRGGFPDKYKSVIMQGVSLAVILIGLSMALETQNVLVLTLSIVSGGVLGEALRIEERLDSFGKKLEKLFNNSNGQSGNLSGSHSGNLNARGGDIRSKDGRGSVVSISDGGDRQELEHVCIGENINISRNNIGNSVEGSGCGVTDQGSCNGWDNYENNALRGGCGACNSEGFGRENVGDKGCSHSECSIGNTDGSGEIDGEGKSEGDGERDKGDEGDGLFIKGFVTGSLVFCVGAMAIMGALESGLTGRHTTLFIKSILDGVTATVFASTMGIGVAFSALPVFLYQGAITVAAVYVKPFLTDAMITEMTAVGGLLIFGIGLNMLTDKLHIKVGNLLPAIFIAIFFVVLFGKLSF